MAGTRIQNATRNTILDAVDMLLGEIGYTKLSVQDIADRAGISRRTFYGYFSSKEAATLACLDRRIAQLVRQLKVIADQQQSATDRLRSMMQLRIRFLNNVSHHRHQANDEIYGQLRPLYMPRRERYLASEARVLQHVLDEGTAQAEFCVANSMEVSRLLIMATNAFLPFALSPNQLRRPKQIIAQADKLIDVLLRGLTTNHTGT